MQDTQQMLAPGTLVRERYLVKSLIGRGTSGVVYLVEDQRAQLSGRRVFALKKIIGLSKQERVQLTFNSVALRQITHPALPHIHHVFNDDRRKRVCIVMEYVDGPDLETMYQHQADQRFSWPEVREMLAPIVDALSYLHRQIPPILHGDVKPINIVLAQPDERFMLVDIGVTRESGSHLSSVHQLAGYKAPEQYGKSVDERADIYGLGATCYTLLTGIVPPNALERRARLDRGQADSLKPVDAVAPSVPKHVARALHRSLSIHASERFASVEEFWQAMQMPIEAPAQEYRPDAPTSTPLMKVDSAPESVPQTPVPAFLERPRPLAGHLPPVQRKLVALGLLAMILLAGTGIGIWSLVQTQRGPAISVRKAATAATTPIQTGTVSIATPTSSPGSYPSIVGSYAGTIVDVPIKSTATVLFQGIHQIGGTISGFFTSWSPVSIDGAFQGSIDLSKSFHLIVMDADGHPLLFLEGAIQTAQVLSGDFYLCATQSASQATCVRSDAGFGIWSAKMVSPGG